MPSSLTPFILVAGAFLFLLLLNRAPRRAAQDAFPFSPDRYVRGLRAGNPDRVFGINLNLIGPPPKEFIPPYKAFIADLSRALDGLDVYLYPTYSIHITAGALVPFTHNGITDPAERELLKRAWAAAFRDFLPNQACWPKEPFAITYVKPVLDTSAGYFAVEDPSGAVARIRMCLKTAQDEFIPAFPGVTADLVDRTKFKVPGIIHSTFLRFGPNIASSEVSGDEIRARFESAARSFQPVTLRIDHVNLVEERVPYMHLQMEGRDADCVLSSVPFG